MLLEEVVVGVRDAELLADHQRRHRKRKRGHQVGGLVPGQHRVDVLVHDLLDARLQRLHPLDGELADDAAPGRAVFRRVHRDQRRAQPRAALLAVLEQDREAGVEAVRTESRVVQHRPQVLVPVEHPGALAGVLKFDVVRASVAEPVVARRRRERAGALHRECGLLRLGAAGLGDFGHLNPLWWVCPVTE
ncbi:hypothetical protein A4R44_06977 [Amycolatopsis sp. M39]|nr:hypothetical protein A4R44_06977 [Amycolatopsis sp. M39]